MLLCEGPSWIHLPFGVLKQFVQEDLLGDQLAFVDPLALRGIETLGHGASQWNSQITFVDPLALRGIETHKANLNIFGSFLPSWIHLPFGVLKHARTRGSQKRKEPSWIHLPFGVLKRLWAQTHYWTGAPPSWIHLPFGVLKLPKFAGHFRAASQVLRGSTCPSGY